MRSYKIGVLAGDGVGPEVMGAALKVLDAAQDKFSFELELHYADAGTHCLPHHNTILPKSTLNLLKSTDACLKGPVLKNLGEKTASEILREHFDLHASIYSFTSFRPYCLFPDVDFLLVRERSEGLSGIEKRRGTKAVATRTITSQASKKIALTALEFASQRKNYLTIVDKSDVLPLSDGLFRTTIFKTRKAFKKVQLHETCADLFARNVLKHPSTYDVVLTENMYGAILAGEATQLVGGIGMIPVMQLGKNYAVFETVHGAAPKYTNMNKVNPIAMILSTKMMLSHLGEEKAAQAIHQAVSTVLKEGRFLTYDLGGESSTSQVAAAISHTLLHQNK